MDRKGMMGKVWRLIYPLLLYEILSYMAAFFAIRIPGTAEETIALTGILLNALLTAPVFVCLYVQDCRMPERQNCHQGCVPFETYYLIWGVTSCAALAVLGNVLISLTPLAEWSGRFQETQEALSAGSIWIQILASVVAAPVLEELLMRGLLYQRMRDVLGVRTSIVFNAILFGVLHGNLVQGVYAFLMGLYFAWLMERFQNIWIPIMGHMAANFTIILFSEGYISRFSGNGMDFILELVVCAGCVGRAIQILKK